MTALKVQLYRDLKARDMSRAELMRRLNWKTESVDRLLRIDHASKLDQIEAAFAAPGERLNFRVENTA